MPKYIDFTASPTNPHVQNTYGSPVHDGHIPSARRDVQAIRVDGTELDFADASMPTQLHRTLIEAESLKRKGAVVDCVTFAALMHGVRLGQHNEEGLFQFREQSTEQDIDPADTTIVILVNLGRRTDRTASGLQYLHTVSPAHLTTEAQYIHKLGESGPICISGLVSAMQTFRCTLAHPTDLVFG